MKEKDNNKHLPGQQQGSNGGNELPGYPAYPASEDIFNKYQEEKDLNPEDISKTKELNEKTGKNRVNDLSEDASGSDLDVPGSELDDAMEDIGSEDEENNYYSIGGDDHSDLDENKGD
jgi:hypothetical protein